MALGCSGLQRRQSPRPASLQFRENAGFCETNWAPLAGTTSYSAQSFEDPVEVALPPIVDPEEVALSAPVRQRHRVAQAVKPQRSIQDFDQADVRTVAGERPLSTPMTSSKLDRVRDQSQEAEVLDVEVLDVEVLDVEVQEAEVLDVDDSPYDYYAP